MEKMDQKMIDDIVALISKINLGDDPIAEDLIKFVKTYDGTNQKEMATMMMEIIIHLLAYKELLVKATGYEGMKEMQQKFDADMQGLKETFEKVQNKEFIPHPPIIEIPQK